MVCVEQVRSLSTIGFYISKGITQLSVRAGACLPVAVILQQAVNTYTSVLAQIEDNHRPLIVNALTAVQSQLEEAFTDSSLTWESHIDAALARGGLTANMQFATNLHAAVNQFRDTVCLRRNSNGLRRNVRFVQVHYVSKQVVKINRLMWTIANCEYR